MSIAGEYFTVPEIAALLKLSTSQVYALVDCGKLRVHRFTTRKNGAVRISQEQLSAYLNATVSNGGGASVPQPEPARASGFTTLDADRLRQAWAKGH